MKKGGASVPRRGRRLSFHSVVGPQVHENKRAKRRTAKLKSSQITSIKMLRLTRAHDRTTDETNPLRRTRTARPLFERRSYRTCLTTRCGPAMAIVAVRPDNST